MVVSVVAMADEVRIRAFFYWFFKRFGGGLNRISASLGVFICYEKLKFIYETIS